MDTHFRRFEDLTPADLAAWRALAAEAAEPNPFFEPEALLPAARYLRRHPVELLIVQDTDGWIAAVPVERRIRYGKLPGPCRLASGLPVGGDLEYADEVTLGRAFEGRRFVEAS